MAFTYSDALATDRDNVRFAIGDTTLNAGPKPADANYSDAEIAALVTREGNWQRAVAAVFENLADLWARHVSFNADGTQVAQSDIAKQYREAAVTWRRLHGSCGSASTTRADGYSDDLDNVTTDDTE
jgi:hypothetical protein